MSEILAHFSPTYIGCSKDCCL